MHYDSGQALLWPSVLVCYSKADLGDTGLIGRLELELAYRGINWRCFDRIWYTKYTESLHIWDRHLENWRKLMADTNLAMSGRPDCFLKFFASGSIVFLLGESTPGYIEHHAPPGTVVLDGEKLSFGDVVERIVEIRQ